MNLKQSKGDKGGVGKFNNYSTHILNPQKYINYRKSVLTVFSVLRK